MPDCRVTMVARLSARLVPAGITVKGRAGAKGQPLTEEELQKEAAQLRESLHTVENRIEQAKRELAGNKNRDEQDIWETNLVILQVSDVLHSI